MLQWRTTKFIVNMVSYIKTHMCDLSYGKQSFIFYACTIYGMAWIQPNELLQLPHNSASLGCCLNIKQPVFYSQIHLATPRNVEQSMVVVWRIHKYLSASSRILHLKLRCIHISSPYKWHHQDFLSAFPTEIWVRINKISHSN